MKRLAVASALCLASVLAEATPIYRCGQTYSQTPCPGGKLIDAADPRSAAQRAEAREVAARERALAAQLTRDREDQEAATPPAQATGFDSRAPAKATSQPAAVARKKARRTKVVVPREVIVVAPKGQQGSRP